MVVEFLGENNEKAVLILSRQHTNNMLRDYSDYFIEVEVGGLKGIELKEGISVEQLVNKFRGYLPLNLLLAFSNSKCVRALGG